MFLLDRNTYNLLDYEMEEIAALREKSIALKNELAIQQERKQKLEEKYGFLKLRIVEEATYHNSVLGLLSTMLWDASEKDQNVNKLVQFDKLGRFYCYSIEVLDQFVNPFKYEKPEPGCDLGQPSLAQLPLALCGCVANLASTTDGAVKVLSDLHGKNFIKKLLKMLPFIPPRSGDRLQWVVLLVLHNISLKGFLMLKNKTVVVNALVATVSRRRIIADLTPLALHMIEFLTSDMTNEEYMRLKHLIKDEIIEPWTHSEIPQICTPALKTLQNLTKAYNKFEL